MTSNLTIDPDFITTDGSETNTNFVNAVDVEIQYFETNFTTLTPCPKSLSTITSNSTTTR